MDYLRKNIVFDDGQGTWPASYVSANNASPPILLEIPGNQKLPGDPSNLLSPSMNAWFEVELLNDRDDTLGFATRRRHQRPHHHPFHRPRPRWRHRRRRVGRLRRRRRRVRQAVPVLRPEGHGRGRRRPQRLPDLDRFHADRHLQSGRPMMRTKRWSPKLSALAAATAAAAVLPWSSVRASTATCPLTSNADRLGEQHARHRHHQERRRLRRHRPPSSTSSPTRRRSSRPPSASTTSPCSPPPPTSTRTAGRTSSAPVRATASSASTEQDLRADRRQLVERRGHPQLDRHRTSSCRRRSSSRPSSSSNVVPVPLAPDRRRRLQRRRLARRVPGRGLRVRQPVRARSSTSTRAQNDASGNPQFYGSYNAMASGTYPSYMGLQMWGGTSIMALDVNGDRKIDLLVGSGSDNGTIRVFLNTCTLQSPLPNPLPPAGKPLPCASTSPPHFTYAGALIKNLGFGTGYQGGICGLRLRRLRRRRLQGPDRRLAELLLERGPTGSGCGRASAAAASRAASSQHLSFVGAATSLLAADFSLDGKTDLIATTDNWNYGYTQRRHHQRRHRRRGLLLQEQRDLDAVLGRRHPAADLRTTTRPTTTTPASSGTTTTTPTTPPT